MAETFYWGTRYWGPNDKAAFSRWLAAHGETFSHWVHNHPGPASRVFGIGAPFQAPPSLDQIASQQADAQIQPVIDQLDTERAQAAARSRAMATDAEGFYAALAKQLGSAAPAVSDAYTSAAGENSAIAKGFSDAQTAISAGEATDINSFLAKTGAPAAQQADVAAKAGGSGAGDVLYGLGGYIPATNLNREGAAFASAAAHLPAVAVGNGQAAIAKVMSDFAQTDQQFGNQIADTLAKRPELVQSILNDLRQQQRDDLALKIQEAYLGNTVSNTAADNSRADAQVAATAKNRAQSRADKAAAARQSAIKEREDAFAQAQKAMFSDAQAYSTPMSLDDQIAWVAAHPGSSLAQAPKAKRADYVTAKKALFNKYSYLLRYATRAGRAALKKRLNQLIDQALASVGIKPGPPNPFRQISPGAAANRPDNRAGRRGP